MKVALLLACTCAALTTTKVSSAAIEAPYSIISLDDISESDRKTLEYLDSKLPRPKRSGSSDILSSLKASIGQGIKSKLSLIARSSAAASAGFSKTSSGGSSGGGGDGHGYYHHDHHPSLHYEQHPHSHDEKNFDFWQLKKSILNTLLQAVKAIKGGVIALKGQLVKGSGYLVSAKGKLLKAKGEAITNLGKTIAANAVLVPHPSSASGHGTSGHEGVGHGHYHPPSGPPSGEYGAPSAAGPEFYPHHHHHEDNPALPHDVQAGVLILKKIPPHGAHDHHHQPSAQESKVPHFKSIAASGPSFGTIIGKFFKASTSLNPGDPEPFNDHDHYHHPPDDDHHHDDDHHDDHHHDVLPESDPTHDSTPPQTSFTEILKSHSPTFEGVDSPPPTSPGIDPSSSHLPPEPTVDEKPPSSTGFGSFEASPTYVNHNDFSTQIAGKPEVIATNETPLDLNPVHAFDEVRPLAAYPVNLDLPSSLGQHNLLLGNHNPINENYPPLPPNIPSQDAGIINFGHSFQGGDSNIKQLSPNFNNFDSYFGPNSYGNFDHIPSYSNKVPIKKFPPQSLRPPPHLNVIRGRLPPKPTFRTKRPYDVVKSISYELGPNGPKRL